MEYIKKCQDEEGKFSYKLGTNGKPSLTGMGVYCLQIGNNGASSEAKKGLEWLFENLPSKPSELNFYGLRHSSKAYYAATFYNNTQYWRAFSQKTTQLLLTLQKVDGSWQSANHFHGDSELFRTTLALDSLLTFYGMTNMWTIITFSKVVHRYKIWLWEKNKSRDKKLYLPIEVGWQYSKMQID